MMKISFKVSKKTFFDILYITYGILLAGSVGVFFASIFSASRVRFTISMAFALPVYISYYIFTRWVVERGFSVTIFKGMMILIGLSLYNGYLTADAQIMISKRRFFYVTSDYFLGCGHLFTDWVFLFWKDLIIDDKKAGVVIADEKASIQTKQTIDL